MTQVSTLLLLALEVFTMSFSAQRQHFELEISLKDVRHKGILMVGIYNENEGFAKINKAYRILTYNAQGERTIMLKEASLFF